MFWFNKRSLKWLCVEPEHTYKLVFFSLSGVFCIALFLRYAALFLHYSALFCPIPSLFCTILVPSSGIPVLFCAILHERRLP